MSYKKSGLTIFELSIVLVIIGLIIGAISVGRTMIDNAERQSVIADIGNFKTAIKLFKEKYNYLPGDFPYATEYWSHNEDSEPTLASLFIAPAYAGIERSTGQVFERFPYQGDHKVGGPGSGPLRINPEEALQAWAHLAAAGLIPGSYTGVGSGAGQMYYEVGVNVPKGSFRDGGYSFSNFGTIRSQDGVYDARYGHVIVYGSPVDVSGNDIEITYPINGPLMGGDDALAIDMKADDGKPDSGNVMAYAEDPDSPNPNCVDSLEYDSSTNSAICSLIFVTGY